MEELIENYFSCMFETAYYYGQSIATSKCYVQMQRKCLIRRKIHTLEITNVGIVIITQWVSCEKKKRKNKRDRDKERKREKRRMEKRNKVYSILRWMCVWERRKSGEGLSSTDLGSNLENATIKALQTNGFK